MSSRWRPFTSSVTTTCDGLSQWGSQELAQAGADSVRILRRYYGEDVQIVTNAPVQDLQESYPGSPVRRGDIGVNVSFLQVALNRISQNYPAIPKVPVDAILGEATENAVRAFQSIFSLAVDGIVGRATWYAIVMLYTAVLKLGELQSQGQTFTAIHGSIPNRSFPASRREGDAPAVYAVRHLAVQFRRAGAAGERRVRRKHDAGRTLVPAGLRPPQAG
ncbi:MAG: peptidoglycan-binding protein [Oscillospiraceae bacterium]